MYHRRTALYVPRHMVGCPELARLDDMAIVASRRARATVIVNSKLPLPRKLSPLPSSALHVTTVVSVSKQTSSTPGLTCIPVLLWNAGCIGMHAEGARALCTTLWVSVSRAISRLESSQRYL